MTKHTALTEMARLIRTTGNASRHRPETIWQIPRAFAQGTGAPKSHSGKRNKSPTTR